LFDLQPLIPDRLTVDTYKGEAWIGLVLFRMAGVRPWWFPAVPGLSYFCETNVRTYVHLDGRDPGVLFFSLDASSSLAVRIARARWKLPYHRAAMQFQRTQSSVQYDSRRFWPGRFGVGGRVEATVGDPIAALDKEVPAGQAVPGTLEHFLAERYLLYTPASGGRLLAGQVHHTPYPLCEADTEPTKQTFVSEVGVEVGATPDHVLFSPGVDVEVFPLQQV
jgi:hypothetical protein